MEIRQLITFINIAQLQSFTRASEKLGYSQSALTIQIRNLEEELSAKLFDRIGKKTLLTPQGKEFLEYAYSMINQMNQAKLSLSSEELTHRVRIGTIDSLCLSRMGTILTRLHTLHPGIKISLIVESPERLLDLLDCGDLDLIYILDRPRFNRKWMKVFEKKEEIVLVCHPNLPIADRKTLHMPDLLSYPFILTEKNANYRYAFDLFLSAKQIDIDPMLEISDTDFIIKMLKKTEAISVLPYFTVENAIHDGSLNLLNVSGFHPSMYSQIFYHRDKWVTGEMKAVIELIKTYS